MDASSSGGSDWRGGIAQRYSWMTSFCLCAAEGRKQTCRGRERAEDCGAGVYDSINRSRPPPVGKILAPPPQKIEAVLIPELRLSQPANESRSALILQDKQPTNGQSRRPPGPSFIVRRLGARQTGSSPFKSERHCALTPYQGNWARLSPSTYLEL